MVEFLAEYGLFLLKVATVVGGILAVIGAIVASGNRGLKHDDGHIEVRDLNASLENMTLALKDIVLDPLEVKREVKAKKKADKARHKACKKALRSGAKAQRPPDSSAADQSPAEERRRRVYVIDFNGDLRASQVRQLRQEISAVLTMATPEDEVVVKLESAGGMVHSYGLAASQLDRVRARQLPLTVCVDKVAASGGYMMACIGTKILASPFAMIGSVGVVAQLPNFHRLLKKHDVDFEMLTAGEYKRTLTVFGENTEKGRDKFIEELQETHDLFKAFVAERRPGVDIDNIATGEVWYGSRALEEKLVDGIGTSDQYLMDLHDSADCYEIKFVARKNLQEKLGLAAEGALSRVLERAVEKLLFARFLT